MKEESSGVGVLFAGRNNGRLISPHHRTRKNLSGGKAKPKAPPKYYKGERKAQVAELYAQGLTTGQIAERIGTNGKVVGEVLQRIRADLGWQAQ